MRKTALYLAAWFAAGAIAVTLASVGVSMVSDRVTDHDRPAPLSAAEVQDQLEGAAEEAAAAEAAGTTTTVPVGPPVTSGEGPTGSIGGPTTTTRGPSTPSGGSGSAPTVAPPATTTTSPPPAPAATTRNYSMVGGTATLRFTAGGVTVLAATPNAGFSAEVSDVHDGGARVEFEGEDHRSRIDGWWASGPQDEVREED